MSTQIQLHVRTEEMTDQMLRSEGHLHGGMAGIMGQLMGGPDYFDELNDLLWEGERIVVGSSNEDGPSDIADLYDGVTEVTERNIKQARAIMGDSEDIEEDIVEWLEENEGEEIFSIHW